MKFPTIGDRIRLIAMGRDPDPMLIGTIGTVVDATRHGEGPDAWAQIDVEWEDGRALLLAVPPDRVEIGNEG